MLGELRKRTPGHPLSEAEREQRREAARARWRNAAVGGWAGAAAAAGVHGAGRALAARAMRQGKAEAEAISATAERRVARHRVVVERIDRHAGSGWPLPAWRRHLGRESRFLDREMLQRAETGLSPDEVKALQDRRMRLDLRMQAATIERPRRREGWYVAGQKRTTRGKPTIIPPRLKRPMDERLPQGWIADRDFRQTQPLDFPTGGDVKEMRADVRATLGPRHKAFAEATRARAVPLAAAAQAAGVKRARQVLGSLRMTRGRMAVASLAGALAGLGVGQVLSKRRAGTPLSQEELEQRREAGRASAARRRRNLGDYEREVRAIPMLGEDEEKRLIARWKDKGDDGARERVLGAHLRLAVSGARRLSGYGLPVEDLVAAGNVGVLQAAERFDPSKGARFASFAQPYIRAAQLRHVLDNWSIVRLGTDRDQKRLFFSLRGDLRTVQQGEAIDDKVGEIAARRGVKTASVRSMAERLSGRDASLNTRQGDDDEGDEWLDRLAGSDHAEETLVARETGRVRRAAAARAIAGLSERERRVISARWLRQPPATLQEVGIAIGVSAERVRQIENQAMGRVRAKLLADPRLAKQIPSAPPARQRGEAARELATGGGALAGTLAAALAKAATAFAIDEAARAAREPASDAQAEAGNYRKGHIALHGMRLAIETARGSMRRKFNKDGSLRWEARMPAHYGYVKGSEGADGDEVDVYLAEEAHDPSCPVFVVDQHKLDGTFDEHKAVLGARTEAAALAIYDAGFTDGSGPRRRRGVTRLSVEAFRDRVVGGGMLEQLAKVAPPDDMPFDRPDYVTPSAAQQEAALAARLGALFRSWLEKPGQVGNRQDIAQALDPLWGLLRSSAEAVSPPPPVEDSLYGTPDSRVIAISFDARSPEVERRLREYALGRIRAITDEARETIRQVLVEAAQQGLPVDQQARRIREAIGLAPGQQAWVSSYRRGLEVLDPRVLQRALRDRRHDGPISRAVSTGTPLASEDIDRYVASYQRRALAYRAISIARTEALRGANTGMIESARVMLQEHQDVTVEKTWIATDDERTRDTHSRLNGMKVVGLDQPFEIDGKQIRWPHDDQADAELTVGCRCTLGLRLIPKPGHGRFIAEAA